MGLFFIGVPEKECSVLFVVVIAHHKLDRWGHGGQSGNKIYII